MPKGAYYYSISFFISSLSLFMCLIYSTLSNNNYFFFSQHSFSKHRHPTRSPNPR
jgi:hypothetical protein